MQEGEGVAPTGQIVVFQPSSTQDKEAITPPPKDCHQIINGLYLGSFQASEQLDSLLALGITHILGAAASLSVKWPSHFTYLMLDDVVDSPEQDLLSLFPASVLFIEEALKSQGKILVMCMAGVSRSASVVIAFLMYSLGLKYKRAFELVQRARPWIQPNAGFVVQLKQFRLLGFSTSEPPATASEKAQEAFRQYAHMKRVARLDKFGYMLTQRKRIPSLAFADNPIHKTGSTYCCGQCGHPLFVPENILTHTKKKDSLSCNAIFLQPMYWMIGLNAEAEVKKSIAAAAPTGEKAEQKQREKGTAEESQRDQQNKEGEKGADSGDKEKEKGSEEAPVAAGGERDEPAQGEGGSRRTVELRRITSHGLELEDPASYIHLTNERLGPLARWAGTLSCPQCDVLVGCFNWVANGCVCGTRMKPAMIAYLDSIKIA